MFDAGARVPVVGNAGVNVWWLYGASPLRFATVNVRESAGAPTTLIFTGGRRTFSTRDFPGFGDAALAAVEAAVPLEFSAEAPLEDVTVDFCRSLVGRLARAAANSSASHGLPRRTAP